MKIIFDSEEQMDGVLHTLSGWLCPAYLATHVENIKGGRKDRYCDEEALGSCVNCWKTCGIEMEVKSQSDDKLSSKETKSQSDDKLSSKETIK